MCGVLSRNLPHANPDIWPDRRFLAAKKGQEKDNNSRLYISRSGNSDCPSSKSRSGERPLQRALISDLNSDLHVIDMKIF